MSKNKLSVTEGIVELMAILGEATIKGSAALTEEFVPVKGIVKSYEGLSEAGKKKFAPKGIDELSNAAPVAIKPEPKAIDVVYGYSGAVQVGSKNVNVGPKKRGKGGSRAVKNDATRETLKDLFIKVISESKAYGAESFTHSSEGYVVRMPEADYTFKVTRSVKPKFELEEGAKAEVTFISRGKIKNSAPGMARMIYLEIGEQIENSVLDLKIVDAKASGIVVQGAAGEYTIKISKKRDRVGFEAERGDAYEK